MLRIWDCFLLEGPKTLFRFAVALLCLNESTIMEKSDTISVMKIIKGTAKLTYDVDGLLDVAFNGLKPFPKRRDLVSKQSSYLRQLKERLKQKRQLRNAALTGNNETTPPSSPSAMTLSALPLDALVFDSAANTALLAYGNQNAGKLAIINLSTGQLQQQSLEFDCRIVSLLFAEQVQLGFLSLVSGYLVAFSSDRHSCRRLWELKMADTILHMIYQDKRLYAALANGSLAVMENCSSNSPTAVELYYIPIGPAPLAYLAVVNEHQLWVAMGNKAVVLNIKTLDCVEQVFVAGNTSGACVSFFDKMLCMRHSTDGVWLATAHSSLVQLWDPVTFTCRLLFDISTDHNSRRSTAPTDNDVDAQITALMCHENTLWVGTADGYLIVYEKQRRNVSPQLSSRGMSISSNAKHSTISMESSGRYSNKDIDKSPTKPHDESIQVLSQSVSQSSGYGSDTVRSNRGSTLAIPKVTRTEHPVTTTTTIISTPPATTVCSSQRPATMRQRINRRKAVIARTRSTVAMNSSDRRCEKSSNSNLLYVGRPLGGGDQKQLSRSESLRMDRNRTISGSHITVAPTYPDSHGRSNTDQKQVSGASDHQRARNMSMSMSDLGAFGSLRKRSGATLLERLRSATSFSSVHTYDASTDNMDYDDLFFVYNDEANKNRASGGLCTTTLARTESVWSLQGHPLPLQQVPVHNNNQPIQTPESEDGGIQMSFKRQDVNGNTTSIDVEAETPVTIRRKDLMFDDNMSTVTGGRHSPSDAASCYFAMSETASVLSINSNIDPPFSYTLNLCMKLKISDKAVKCLAVTKVENEQIVLSCAGNYGDDEAVLKWTKEHDTGLWLNNPVVDVNNSRYSSRRSSVNMNGKTSKPVSRSTSLRRK